MTIQIKNAEGLIEQFAGCDVMYIASEKGKNIDKWDMSNMFINLDMDDLRNRETYLVIELRNRIHMERHIYTNDCIAVVKGE